MNPAVFFIALGIVVVGYVASVLLFLLALCWAAKDADELACEHAEHKRGEAIRVRDERVRELESVYALPARAPRRVR